MRTSVTEMERLPGDSWEVRRMVAPAREARLVVT